MESKQGVEVDSENFEIQEEEEQKIRPQFGNRFLTQDDDVFKHNAWDNVEWDDEQEKEAELAVSKNSSIKIQEDLKRKLELEANQNWDQFYSIHQNRFFKDRHWLFTEFPDLAPDVDAPEKFNSVNKCQNFVRTNNETPELTNCGSSNRKIFEIGCGVGNSINTILKYSNDENLFVYGCDFSAKAIEILKESSEYDSKRCEVFVMDITRENWRVPFEENSIDIILIVFVLSAIHPDKMKIVAENCAKYLKPNGQVMFRDYGRYDLAQLRFKNGKCLEDNFYVRGDNTLVYFFTQQEIKKIFEDAGLIEDQNLIDRRLQVNRGKLLKMYRVWIQAKYRKPNF